MMCFNHIKWFSLILIFLVSVGFLAVWVSGADSEPGTSGISINAENEALKNVLEKISLVSGYEIEFDQEWGNHPINIHIENESLEDALYRVLSNLNHALIWDDAEKKISIFINGNVSARGGSTSSPSVRRSSPVSRDSRVQKNPMNRSTDRAPSRSYNEVKKTSPPASVSTPRGQPRQSEGDLPVSVTGRKTRFGQGTSTID